MFRKKGKKDGREVEASDDESVPGEAISEDDIIDFEDFRDLDEGDEEDIGDDEGSSDFEKHFIFHISGGCPICGGDVKGNDHFRYLCENCNVLFDKKDVIDSEFGRRGGGVRKTRLSEDERKDLQKRRDELKERVFSAFSEEEKKEVRQEAEDRMQEVEEVSGKPVGFEGDAVPGGEPGEEVSDDAGDEGETDLDEPEYVDAEVIPPGAGLDDLAAHAGLAHETGEMPGPREGSGQEGPDEDERVDEGEPDDEEADDEGFDEGVTGDEEKDDEETDGREADDEEAYDEVTGDGEAGDEETDDGEQRRRAEYHLESPERIIASNESTKMHKGDCHFVKRIHPENRVYLDSVEQGIEQGYDLCVCLRRLKAMRR